MDERWQSEEQPGAAEADEKLTVLQDSDPDSECTIPTDDEIAAMEAFLKAKYGDRVPAMEESESLEDMDPVLAAGYGGLTDEKVVEMCHQNDTLAMEYLLNKYKNFVRSKARSYFLIGADHEDIVQEGMIGLFKAIRDFKPDKLASFRAFAELCITRQIITAIKTATRQKHIPLNSYVSLNKPIYDEESDRTLMDVIVEKHIDNPEELIISQEDLRGINTQLSEMLSDLEKDALNLYLDGKSYVEIAEELGRHSKSIDNALQRVKRKLERYLRAKRHEESAV